MKLAQEMKTNAERKAESRSAARKDARASSERLYAETEVLQRTVWKLHGMLADLTYPSPQEQMLDAAALGGLAEAVRAINKARALITGAVDCMDEADGR